MKYSLKDFHQDHMHPHTELEGEKDKDLILADGIVIDDDRKVEWRRRKNAMPIMDWLKIPENSDNVKYLSTIVSYELVHFEEFMENRWNNSSRLSFFSRRERNYIFLQRKIP